MELMGSTALVTGGAVRLGRAIALGLARAGADVAISYSSSAGPADETVSEILALGRRAVAFRADFGGDFRAEDLVLQTEEALGPLSVLVNSAAIFEHGNWDDTTEENWERHFSINLKAPFFLSQAFGRRVKGQFASGLSGRRGHVVNIADWRAVRPGTDHVAYTLAKAGLVAMTKSLALALAPEIQVNAVAPGIILPPPGADDAFIERKAAQIPARRVGSPEEVVKAVLYLLDSDFVTGDLVYVTGGEHL
ncbi:MAG: SDR family oxidoreductase [Anaerolineae bacterium]|nr:SDR family oxidoreductase [Anaerolineae bacterium]